MNTHKNARLTFHGRVTLVRRIVEHGLRTVDAAQAMAVSPRTAYKWLRRYQTEGEAGLYDRSSRPSRCPHRISAQCREQIVVRRRQRRIYRAISHELKVSESTVARVLRPAGLNRLSSLDPVPPNRRYVHEAPGDLLHLDIKKLGRFWRPGHRVTGSRHSRSIGAGWDYVHVAIDDHSRVSWATIKTDEKGASAWRALISALRYYRSLGVRVTRLLTDRGACYRSAVFAKACRRLGLKHRFTKPYCPRTNGKAERLIQTALHEWAYARSYADADQRAAHLPHWLHDYNWHRPHASLNYHSPVSALDLSVNNLLALHILVLGLTRYRLHGFADWPHRFERFSLNFVIATNKNPRRAMPATINGLADTPFFDLAVNNDNKSRRCPNRGTGREWV